MALRLAERGERRIVTAALPLLAEAGGFLAILRSPILPSPVLRIAVLAAAPAFGLVVETAALATFTARPATILAAVAALLRLPALLPPTALLAVMRRFGATLAGMVARAGAIAAVRLRAVILLAAAARCGFAGLPRAGAIFFPATTVRDAAWGAGFAVLAVRFAGAAADFFAGFLARRVVRAAPVWPA